MTAARADEPGTIPPRIWQSLDGRAVLDVCGVSPGGGYAQVFANDPGRAIGVALTSQQLRAIAADFVERAEVLDNVSGRNRKTPAWHIREGDRALRRAEQDTDASDADVHALIAAAHYQAAQALRSGTTQVVNHHHIPSGKDTE